MLDRNPNIGVQTEAAQAQPKSPAPAARSRVKSEGPAPPQAEPSPVVDKPPSNDRVASAPPVIKPKRRLLFLVIAVVIGGGAATGAWWWWSQAQVAVGAPILYGNVDIREVALAFDASERITSLDVQEGDRVKQGQVLARLDTRHIDAQIAAAQAAVAAQQAALDKLVAGNRPEEIAEARANLDAANSNAALAAAENRRTQLIAASAGGSSAVSQSQIDAAKSTLDVANAKTEVAQKTLDLEVAGARKEDIAAARAGLSQAQAQLDLLHREADDATLVAPSDGIVVSRLAEPGEMAGPSRTVLSLAIVDPKWVRAYVTETDLAKLHPGMRATIMVDGLAGKTLDGWVGFISPVAEFTPKSVETSELRTDLVYEVRVFVNDPDDTLRLGMPATVTLLADKAAASAAGK